MDKTDLEQLKGIFDKMGVDYKHVKSKEPVGVQWLTVKDDNVKVKKCDFNFGKNGNFVGIDIK